MKPSVALFAAAFGGLLGWSALVAAAPAHATCPSGQFEDPTTRMCWTQIAPELSAGMSGEGPCLPGRLGNCFAYGYRSAGELQNTYMDGKNK